MEIVLVGAFVGIAVALLTAPVYIPLILWSHSRAKRRAWGLLGQAAPDVQELRRAIRRLSWTPGTEAKELSRHLMDKAQALFYGTEDWGR